MVITRESNSSFTKISEKLFLTYIIATQQKSSPKKFLSLTFSNIYELQKSLLWRCSIRVCGSIIKKCNLIFAFLLFCSVHLKIHVPDVVHKHKHVKTKYVHVFHPKVINTDHHSSIQYLHSRHDPNIGLINGGYPQPLLNLKPSSTSEYRISEDDFFKWRREQQRRAQEKRRHHQQQQQQQQKHNDDDDYEDNGTVADDEEEQSSYDEELYKKHKYNKSNSASLNQRKESKQKNHNYAGDDDSSNSDKVYNNYSNLRSKPGKKQRRPQFRPSTEDEKQYRVYGVSNVDAESSNIEAQFLSHDPTAIDPGYYSTLPKNFKNAPQTNQDDIYSGLLAKKYNREIADKSKLLADINYSRKEQTRNLIQRRKSQEE